VAGYTTSYGAGSVDQTLVKYNASGVEQWSKTWGGTGSDYARALVQTSDGGFAVAGYADSYGAGNYDQSLVKYDSNGEIENCSASVCGDVSISEAEQNVTEGNVTISESNQTITEGNVASPGLSDITASTTQTTIVAFAGARAAVTATSFFTALYVASGGRVGIGTTAPESLLHVDGEITATGFVTSTTADIAEYYQSAEKLKAGDIVKFNNNGKLVKAQTGDNPIGAISTAPGLALGKDTGDVPLALAGRVPVKVVTENGAITAGDPITISSTPGVGMKATTMTRIIGYALESASSANPDSTHTIEVFINSTTHLPAPQEAGAIALQHQDASFGNLNITGDATFDGTLTVKGNATFEQDVMVEGKLVVNTSAAINSLSITGGSILSESVALQINALPALGEVGELVAPETSLDGTRIAGTISFTAGANSTLGELAEIIFNEQATEAVPRIAITPVGANSIDVDLYIIKTQTGFRVATKDSLQAGNTYTYDYVIIDSKVAGAATN